MNVHMDSFTSKSPQYATMAPFTVIQNEDPFILFISSPTIGTQAQGQYGLRRRRLTLSSSTIQKRGSYFLLLSNGHHSYPPLQTAGRDPCDAEEDIFPCFAKPCLRQAWCRHLQAASSESRLRQEDTKPKRAASSRTRECCLRYSLRKRARRSTPRPFRTIPRRQRHSRRNAPRHRCIQYLRPLLSSLSHVRCRKHVNDPARTRQRLRLLRHDEHKTLLRDPHPAPRRRHDAASLPQLQPRRDIPILGMVAGPAPDGHCSTKMLFNSQSSLPTTTQDPNPSTESAAARLILRLQHPLHHLPPLDHRPRTLHCRNQRHLRHHRHHRVLPPRTTLPRLPLPLRTNP